MKSKCSFILKASTALVLAMLVLFGSIATVVGAVASADKGESDIAVVARKVADIADTGAKVDLAETGIRTAQIHTNASLDDTWKTTTLSGDGNHYTGTIYFKGKTSGNYEMGMKIDGNWKVFGGYCINSGTTYNTAWGSGGSNNDQIPPISTDTSKYIKGEIEYYNEYSGNPWLKITQSELSALSTTVTVGKTSLQAGQTTTVGKSNSGGSGSYTNTYKVRQGSASGTDVTSSTLSGTTFTAPNVSSSTTYYITTTVTDSNTNAKATSTAKTITVTPAETTYAVTVAAGTNGSVASTSVNAGATTAVALPAATPNYGYKFKNWTASGGGVTIINADSATGATIKATGTGGTVTANFEKNDGLNLYVTGRFRVKDSSGTWHYVGGASGTWNTTYTSDANLKFTYSSTEGIYKLNTRASLNDLKKSANGGNQYFKVYDSSGETWGLSSADTQIKTSENKTQLTNSTNKSLYFDDASDDAPVTICFDATSQKIWYSLPNLYDVNVDTATGGSVTASPARCEAGTSVTLTIEPSPGYQLSSITAKDSSNAAVTLSGTGNTRTFTMPAKNVTVTPVFEKITWSGLTAVGKYSTTAANDASYSNAMSPNPVTIAATSATQIDGVAVSAPATDPTGYVFAGWYTTTGSFANAANKDTIFKPNAADAVAIAKYKKIFEITYSVDNTGTGAGTVSTDKTEVEAGGSYTITATAKSGSAIESVKVNGTAKTATASQTISSVSANQTVEVKFKSNVYLRGGSTIGTNWTTGDAMTSNAAGTEFTKTYENVAGSSSGTQYQFKLYVNGYNNDGNATINITGGASTGTCTHQSSGVQNYVLTLKKNANVTIKSNGTKITEIKVVPTNATKYAVTFKKAANTTITGQYEGTNFTTASADATVQVYSGDEISFKVTAASGYHISTLTGATFTPTFTATEDDYKITNITEAKTITPTAAADVAVTAKTNKSACGTVTVDKDKSFKGDIVKITITPLAGTLKSLTATYGNGVIYDCTVTNGSAGSTWTRRSGTATTTGMATPKASLAEVGANVALAAVGAAQTIDMEMKEDSSVTINATFDTYSADSTWYYNGYDTSGNAVSGYHGKQMTESIVGGEKFSYYHVEGRTGTHQLMTVSNGAASSGTRYVYFTASAEGGWSTDENHQYAYFYNNSGDAGDAWPGYKMTKYTTNDYGQNVYRVEIPTSSSPTGVIFNNASFSPHKTTNVTDLSKGGYYLLTTHHNDNGTEIHDWQSYDCTYPSAGYSTGTEYFYDSSDSNVSTIYSTDSNGKSIFNTTGFYRHGASSKNFAKPRLTASDTGDYYVNVLYPGKTYTINGVTKTIGTDPVVIWSKEPLAGDDENVTIYAKDGAIRSDSFGETYANIANTKIYAADGTTTVGTKYNGSITNQTYETYKAAKGDTIVIKTTIGATDTGSLDNAADLKAKYYVRGFCINGEVTELLEHRADGLYTLTYKIPEDIDDGTKIEITPIYYLKDTSANPIVTYRVTGFTDELKAVGTGKPGWGDTLYTYPYYGKLGGQNNAFGAYPGQPMVYYKGQYQMQIPQKSTAWKYDSYANNKIGAKDLADVNNTTVSGVTMSNGYYDLVHRQIMGYGDNSSSADHVQTYDYGDFYKIFNEKKPVDNIVFDFKYRTKKHNFENQPADSINKSTLDTNYGTNGNGFELLTNFHGRTVDLFGTPLSGDQLNATPVYVVSIGGVNGSKGVENIAGYYATEWVVYGNTSGTTYQRITGGGKNSIPPEVLVLHNNSTSFNNTTYPSADAKHNVTDWKALYTALEAYRGKPVMISYEAADAQIGAGNYATSGGGGATRNDGRWLYSNNGESITSKIKIQYSNDNGVNYTDLDTTSPQVEGLSAYFTNDGVEGEMTYSTTIDPDKTFDFEAKTTNGNYKFVGWYMEDGTKITSDNASHTERSGSYTFIAKFMQVTTGQLILSHSVDTNATYKGAGTAKIGVVVKNGEEVVRTYELSTSDITLDDKIIKSDNSNYTIEVTLQATATGNDMLGTTVLANPSGQEAKFYKNPTSTDSDKTRTIVLGSFTVGDLFTNGTTQNVKNIIYHSYFGAVTFHYDLLFQYTDRFGVTKKFYKQGYLTAAQAANKNYVKVYDMGQNRHERRLMPAFIQTIAPHVSNFGEKITWDFVETGYAFNVQDYEYTLVNVVLATQTSDVKKNVTFKLPYAHTNGIATVNSDKVGTAATSTNFALTGNDAVALKTVPVLPNNAENGIYTEEAWKHWIAAPKTINDNGTPKYFQYWSIKRTEADGANDPEVARCYFQGFNFQILDNYTITPIYDTTPTDISNSGIFTGATYLETSRNQWNTKDDSSASDKDGSGNRIAADLLFNDFVLSYNFKGVDIYKDDSDSKAIQELGVVVERIKELDINQDGTKNTNISNYTSVEENRNTVLGVINGTATDKKFSKHAIEKTSLDNKNRILFFDAFYNGAGWNSENQSSATKYAYKNWVYRAYTYIKYTDGNVTQVQLCEKPTYFTMYDEAVKNYVVPSTSGN